MSVHRSARPIALALVSVSLLVAGCSRPGVSPAGSEAAPTATAAVSSPTASPSTEPSMDGSPAESLGTEPPMPEPPAASIAAEGGDPVVGELGSFAWENSGSDAPWLPGNPIHVGAGERLLLTLSEPVGVSQWTASRQRPGASLDGTAAVGLAEGPGDPVAFDAPPPGVWSVHVSVWFADNLGSAAYYWLMEVD